ncbi:GEL complex subunit OPTI [Toxorhynchites rutilus septentrionalis]|uniref:GEL complex subunit OPTI n=1 Tax=Toxorhynchites rutilus septentrionalis TaxID=329112 RepID=UPI002479C711|nr:GEL complex subunit OPTI [Toxorhynchites rutilus septentrionalis]
MATKVNQADRKGKTKNGDLKSIWNRAITPHSEWIEKDDFLDVIYWSRQIVGIFIGIVMGIIPLKGFIAIALFVMINCGIVYLYCTNFQMIDEEAFGGIWEIIKEGFMTSFACFLVTWIVLYTGIHFDDLSMEKLHLSYFWEADY